MHYCIRVRGHLGQHGSTWFEGLTITNEAHGQAILTGLVADQAALYGVLTKIRDLGLPLIAVAPANTRSADYSSTSDWLD